MKKLTKILVLVVFSAVMIGFSGISTQTAEAAVRVKAYYKPSTGTYVAPSYRSSPNKTKFDNYSTKGNYNPYTGKKGTRSY